MNKNNLLIGSLVICFLIIVFTERTFDILHNNAFAKFEDTHLNSAFILLASTISSVIILYIKPIYYTLWFRRFFIWYFPVAYFLTFTFPTYGGIMTMTRSDAAVILGVLMIVVTIGFLLFTLFKNSKRI